MKRKSTGKYPPNWDEIAMAVKDAAGWRCVRCHHGHDPSTGYTLTVHHLDINPANCAWWNIPALCQRCHLTIQGKVVMERPWMFSHSEWFKPYVSAYYMAQYDPTRRTLDYAESISLIDWHEALEFADEYIALGQGLIA